MPCVVALSGTPGTGKSTIAGTMARAGWTVVDLTALARTSGAVMGRDEVRQTDEVDLDLLASSVETLLTERSVAGPTSSDTVGADTRVLLVGHMAHLMPCDAVVVLRTSPRVLEQRLRARGWPEPKVRENLEAEAVGVILVEALELEPSVPVYEMDTTSGRPEAILERIEEALSGRAPDLVAGWVDWAEEVMGWY